MIVTIGLVTVDESYKVDNVIERRLRTKLTCREVVVAEIADLGFKKSLQSRK